MKPEKRKTGDLGENIACKYLINKGYSIVERNYSTKVGEIDIIAKKGNTIAFVEVKTRASVSFGLPCQAVDFKKQRRLILCAEIYMKSHRLNGILQPRMDIIEILFLDSGHYIRHLENAF